MLQKTSRTDYLQRVRLGERARCQREEANTACEQRRCRRSGSVVSPHRMCFCAEEQESITDSLSSSLLFSITCSSHLLSRTALRHGCATQNLRMAHALHATLQIPVFFRAVTNFEEARNLSVGKVVWREARGDGTGCNKTTVSIT